MNTEKNEFKVIWFIENYSYCWQYNGEPLKSPEFTADGLKGTIWYLELYPRGFSDEETNYVSLFLTRKELDDGPEHFHLNFELSILSENREVLQSRRYDDILQKTDRCGSPKLEDMDDILLRRESDYLPEDTLCVCMRINRSEENLQRVKEIIFRTRIGIQQIAFHHEVQAFSSLQPNEKKTIQIGSPSKEGLALSSSLYFADDSCCGKIILEITSTRTNQILSKCKLSVIDSSGEKIECREADNRFDSKRKDIQKLPLGLTRKDILKRKDEYLQDDKLLLLCECDFSTGIEFEKTERTLYELPFKALNHITNDDEDLNTEKMSAGTSVLDDLKEVYDKRFLTDVELKTETQSFPAHKVVLCARSSVFKAMLTNDMKEKNTNCIVVDDLDDYTVQQLLLFLYTDHLEDLEWENLESIIKLYYAGDKYALEKLKLMCTSELVYNLSPSNASEILLLADTHNDSHMRKAVEDYIFQHDKEVFGSDEWSSFLESNTLLASKTMLLKYKR